MSEFRTATPAELARDLERARRARLEHVRKGQNKNALTANQGAKYPSAEGQNGRGNNTAPDG